MAKTIQFSAEEINELRSFYSNELATAEERVKHIRAILAKIGNSSNGREKITGINNSEPVALGASAPAKKKRGRPATKNKKTTVEANTTPKKRGRPAKLKAADAPVVAASGKKRGRKPKLQLALSNNDIIASASSNATAPKGKKRGRKPSSASHGSNDASIGIDKIQNVPKAAGAKRGRKPGKKVENSATKSASESKAVATGKKDKTKPVAKVSGAKRGRKPSIIGKKASDAVAPLANTTTPEAKAIETKKAPKSNSAKADVKKVASSATKTPKEAKSDVKKPAAAKVSKAKSAEKAAKAKVVNAAPAKVVSVKKSAAKETKKSTPAKSAKVQAKVELAPKKVSKKELYQELIFKTFASEPRFYTTEEIVNAGIKEFNLKGKEKDAAKNTMQFILNGLQSQSKILRRRKEKDRQAYWASLGTSDAGYIQ